MKQINIQDYYLAVYLIGWAVVGIGVYIAMKAGLTGGRDDIGLSIIFGGLYITSFVRNAQLKLQVMLLEEELKGR